MSLTSEALAEIVAELGSRPGHEKVRGLVYKLLTDGLGADSKDISFEHQTVEVRGRIDALLGRTVIEIKSDLRKESFEAQLAGYLKDRRTQTGHDYVGIVTDGASFRVFELADDSASLASLGDTYTPDPDQPHGLLRWLDSVVALQDKLVPDLPRIRLELGRDSVLYRRAMRELRDLAATLADHPEATTKRQLWDRLLRVAYGTEVAAPELFLQHTYLVILAKAIATSTLTGKLPASGRALLDGDAFQELGILNAVEADFFDWLLSDAAGDALVLRIATQAARFDLSGIDVDVLKGLYESLIDPAQRHDLGEYYTPDWLAARVCAAAIEAPLDQRVIDPACGSGTFLFHALRQLVAAAEAAGKTPAETVALASERVAGIDVHPVAVIFARATWLLALLPTLQKGWPDAVSVPVYLGDALQWNARELIGKSELEIEVPPAKLGDPPTVLRFPEDVIDQPTLFDQVIGAMLQLAEAGRPTRAMRDWLQAHGVPGDTTMLTETYDKLVTLNAEGRNHIWGYVARNLSRPIWLATDKQKADVVVGNPPWVRFSALAKTNQARLKKEAGFAGVWVGGKAATANDLSAYFFARAVALYMRREGRIAFVLPYAALSRDPYAKFRRGDFQHLAQPVAVRFTAAWTFPSDVQPLFPVPACVLFARGEALPRRLPATVERYRGTLPMRDAGEELAAKHLTVTTEAWPADTGVSASPYREKFRQGATLVPRRLVIVERLTATGKLGGNPAAPRVRGRTSSQDKEPWKSLDPVEGPVEKEFLRPVYLGESIAPYRVLGSVTGVIPWNPNTKAVMDKDGAYSVGKQRLAEWLSNAEKLWNKHGTGGMTLAERWDYGRAISSQFPVAEHRVFFAASGTQPAAVRLTNETTGIAEHKLYWAATKTRAEADFLVAILNSETARAAAEGWQSEGQWGKRDFDKAVFNLPIPLFDRGNRLHRDLAAAAARAEKVAAKIELKDGEHFTRARKRIRAGLIADGVAGEIETLVAELIAPAAAAMT